MIGISFENGESKEMCFGVLLAILKMTAFVDLDNDDTVSKYYFVVGYLLDCNCCRQ